MPTEEVGTLVCGHKACEDCFDQILAGYVGEAEDGEPVSNNVISCTCNAHQ